MQLFGVVPIVTNLGAAALPTILAAFGSVLAILLKPRELVRLVRRHPAASGVVVASTALVIVLTTWWISSSSPARAAGKSDRPADAHYDWTKIALDIIAQENSGKALTSLDAKPPTESKSAESPSHASEQTPTPPVVVETTRNDFSRTNDHGGGAPKQLAPRWAFQPEDTMFLSTPAIHGRHIFVAGCQADLGAYTGLLACLDLETGKPIWQVTQLGDEPLKPFFSSPVITSDGKSLIIGEGLHEDRDCSLRCFDTATGRQIWSVKTPLHIESSPALWGDLAIVGAGAIEGPGGKPVGDPGYVLAVRISDGKEVWRYPVNDPESSPAVDAEGIVYIGSGFNGQALVGLRSDSDEALQEKQLKRLVWRAEVEYPVTGPVTLAGDLAIAGAGNSDVVHSNRNARGIVVAVDRRSGQIRWQTKFDDGVLGSIAAGDGTLICPSRTGEVVALRQSDGQVVWHSPVSLKAPVMAGCALAADHVYAVSSDGFLAVLNAADGASLEKLYLNDQGKPGSGLSLSSPQIIAGQILVGSETGGLRCFVGKSQGE